MNNGNFNINKEDLIKILRERKKYSFVLGYSMKVNYLKAEASEIF